MSPAIQMTDVANRFGKTIALDRVSLSVPRGSVCALLGANGAGKSTAIRILLGLEKPDTGSTEVLGMSSRTHSLEIRRRVGYVSDQPPLYEWMTVQEIGWFASAFYPTGYEQSYLQLVRKFDLPLATRIRNLSRGMRANPVRRLAPRSTAVQDADLGCRGNHSRPHRKYSSVVVAEWMAQNCYDTTPARMDFGGLAAAGVSVADGKCPVVEGSSQWLGLPARLQSPGLFRDCHISAALASRLSDA